MPEQTSTASPSIAELERLAELLLNERLGIDENDDELYDDGYGEGYADGLLWAERKLRSRAGELAEGTHRPARVSGEAPEGSP